MNTMLGTPPRGTQSSTAAFFASPSSPAPRRPVATPSSVASSNLRGASSPLSQRRADHRQLQQPFPTTSATPPPRSSQSSLDRYVCPSSRQDRSMAHFLLTSAERKTPMLIRAAQQRHLSVRSPSRDTASMPSGSLRDGGYPSPTRYAVDQSSPNRGVASPRPHGSLPRAGSTRLSEVFAKMHLDPSVRSSRDRSVSNASAMSANAAADNDAGSPPNFSFPASAMELEPYTTKLARTLFSDVEQTTVLSVNDTAMRPTAPPPPPSFPSVSGNGSWADPSPSTNLPSFASSSLRTPTTPRSPEVADPAAAVADFASTLASLRSRDGESGGVGCHNENSADDDDDDVDAADDDDRDSEEEENAFHRRHYRNANAEAEEDQAWEGDNRGAENSRGRRTARIAAAAASALTSVRSTYGRLPLANSDVNLHGMSEAERYDTSLGVVFECNRTRNFTSPSFRVIPHTPERILDAADMEDDFYMNLIDWSTASDVLCVALQSCVYLWDAKTCGITELPRVATSTATDTRSASAHLVCGLNWAPDGRHLAVGRNSGTVEVWDVEAQQVVHTYRQHTDRVVSLSWEPQGGSLLASGSRDSTIVLRDLREWAPASPASAFAPMPATAVLRGHETEVCGLKWSPDGAMLASGGNDNQLLLWDRRSIHGSSSNTSANSGSPLLPSSSSAQPLFYLNKHTAAVKALSWNPQQPALLASGGGSHDKSLRFWNTLTGECVHHINTGSQVCGVVWNRAGTELVTAHGYTDNQLSIWRYPSLRRIANLIGHTSRVLHLALSADGETVVSAAGDETLRFWRCFPASELRESSPHLYRSFYSPSSASSLNGSPYSASAGAGGGSALRARAAAIAAGRCGSASPDRDSLAFMNEEVELR